MSNLTTLPKGDSAWLLRKSIQRIMQQVSVLETNIGSSTTGNSSNTQVIFNDNGTLRGDAGLTYNAATDTLSAGSATITGDLTVDTSTLKVDSANNRVGIGTASPTSDLDIFRASGSGITSGISLRTAAGAGGDGSFIKWLAGGTNEKVAQIDGVLNGTDVGYLSFQCGNGADAMAEQYRVASSGLFTWYDGAGGTRMTLNSTGLGVGGSPSARIHAIDSGGVCAAFSRAALPAAGLAAMYIQAPVSSGYSNTPLLTFWYQNTGISNPANECFAIRTNSTDRLYIDSSGNLGIGVTPSAAWNAGGNIQVGNLGALYTNNTLGATDLAYNSIRTGADTYQYLFGSSVAASRFQQRDGSFRFFTAPAGTSPNAITFTQAMTLAPSGKLLVGWTTAPTASASLFADGIQCTNTSGGGGYANLAIAGGGIGIYTHTGVAGSETYTERVRVKGTGQVRFVPLAADPAGAEAGDVYYNSVSNRLKYYNGTAWTLI